MRGIRLILVLAIASIAATGSAGAASNVTVTTSPTVDVSFSGGTFTPIADSANLNVAELLAQLALGNVAISSVNPGGIQDGNVTIGTPVSWTSASSLTLTADNNAIVNSPVTSTSPSAALVLNAQNGVFQNATGAIAVAGPTTATANTGNVNLDPAPNNFGQSISVPNAATAIRLNDVNALQLAGASTLTNLTITASGGVTQSNALNVGQNTTITTGSANVTLPHSGNAFGNEITIPAAATVALTGSGDVGLGTVTASGNLDVTAGDEITSAGDQAVTGTTSLAAPTSITAGSFGSDFTGAVSVNTDGLVTLRDMNGLVLGTVASDGADIFAADAVTQTGAITDSGLFEAEGDAVTLTNPANDFNQAQGQALAGALSLRDANSIELIGAGATTASQVIAGEDISIAANPGAYNAGALTLVTDGAAGSSLGPGGIEIAPSAALTSSGAPLRIYTARRAQNTIPAGAGLNGASFTPGTEFADSATEVWNTRFPNGAASNPFTIFYKQVGPPGPRLDPDPETTITKAPKAKVKTKPGKHKAKVSFQFASDLADSTFSCRLDDRPAAPCSSPHRLKAGKGRHLFTVAATSAAGKLDPTPAEARFKVKLRRKR